MEKNNKKMNKKEFIEYCMLMTPIIILSIIDKKISYVFAGLSGILISNLFFYIKKQLKGLKE